MRFGDPYILNEDAFDDDAHALDAGDIRLLDFAYDVPPFVYIYDFGDNWHHRVEIETLLTSEVGRKYPACIDGARSRPPEDVGGTHGYDRFLEIIDDRTHPEYADMRRWAGRGFAPEKFDLVKTDRAVRSAVRTARRRATLAAEE